MLEQLNKVEEDGLKALDLVQDEAALEAWRVANLGRNSGLMQVFSRFGELSQEEKPAIGKRANEVKNALETAFGARLEELRQAALKRTLEQEQLDISLPGRKIPTGRLHPDTQTLRELYSIFGEMGFQVFRSREVESDEYNFQLLNFQIGHPARDMQDTYFVEAGNRGDNPIVLRTHTSPGQIHAMRWITAMNPEDPAPVRIVLPGMCYRYEQVTTRHETQFDQLEGLAVGRGITFSDLKGTLADFARRMFGQNTRTRFRALLLPFHRTLSGIRRGMFPVRRRRLRRLQRFRLAGNRRVWDGPSGGAAQRRVRPGTLQWLCLWPGSAAHGHAEAPHRRHPLFLAE